MTIWSWGRLKTSIQERMHSQVLGWVWGSLSTNVCSLEHSPTGCRELRQSERPLQIRHPRSPFTDHGLLLLSSVSLLCPKSPFLWPHLFSGPSDYGSSSPCHLGVSSQTSGPLKCFIHTSLIILVSCSSWWRLLLVLCHSRLPSMWKLTCFLYHSGLPRVAWPLSAQQTLAGHKYHCKSPEDDTYSS